MNGTFIVIIGCILSVIASVIVFVATMNIKLRIASIAVGILAFFTVIVTSILCYLSEFMHRVYAFTVFAIIVISVCYYFYRLLLKRYQITGLKNIPMPPLSHALLGHPEMFHHPLKHIYKLIASDEYVDWPVFQVTLSKTPLIIINDSHEVGRLLSEMPSKGPIYASYRFDPETPDIFASDGPAHALRHDAMLSSFNSMSISDEKWSVITSKLKRKLDSYVDDDKQPVLDYKKFVTLFAMDVVCIAAFEYELNALDDSIEGDKLCNALSTFGDIAVSSGIYPKPNARVVSKEEREEAKINWKSFLSAVATSIIANKSNNSTSLCASLHKLVNTAGNDYNEKELISEIHQIFKHGHELIAGTLCWVAYALYQHPVIRSDLERDIVNNLSHSSSTHATYVDCFIKEILRKYPVAGNLLVRTVNKDNFLVKGGIEVSKGTPIHMHIWSLQNTGKEWDNPDKFIPDRWRDSYAMQAAGVPGSDPSRPSYAKCPFMKNGNNSSGSSSSIYEGAGHSDGSLSFLPFACGYRSCPAKTFVVDILKRFIITIVPSYRIDSSESWDIDPKEDPGFGIHSCIIPYFPKSTNVIVRAIAADTIGTVVPLMRKSVVSSEWGSNIEEEDVQFSSKKDN